MWLTSRIAETAIAQALSSIIQTAPTAKLKMTMPMLQEDVVGQQEVVQPRWSCDRLERSSIPVSLALLLREFLQG